MLRGVDVLILVDCGASTNFISKTLVKQLNLKVNDTKGYEVEVGTSAKVQNRRICKHLTIKVQGFLLCNISSSWS